LPESITIETNAAGSNQTMPQASSGERSRPVPFGTVLGATLVDMTRCEFRVWAPTLDRVEVKIVGPRERRVPLVKNDHGYHEAVVDDCPAGTRYLFVLDGDKERPDPASRYQPEGVHKASEVVPRDFGWTDRNWRGVALQDYVVYELHVGTFSDDGTFDAIIPRLEDLKDLGVTAIELLPVAQFPGERNWGYDGVFVGAAQNSYGGPLGLKRLVDACHARGIAVILDVVYNHLGPEGNYLGEFGPYFTDRYKTPWGLAINFDGPQSDHVRWYFIHNVLQWVDEFHIDGLRVDAVHAIVDHTAQPFLQDLCAAVHERARDLGRQIFMIAESDLNDPRVITPPEKLGLGFDSQWNDDFHHSLHTLLTGEKDGYYIGYGKVADLAQVFKSGYLYTGQHSVYRARRYGLDPHTSDGAKFVVCAQNHDQVGNRMMGDRLAASLQPDQLKIVAAAVVLSPFIPMLFMGEEYGETAPFQYFTSHSDKDLIEAVRKGRREEFDDFEWKGEPPDPHAEETFTGSRLKWSLGREGEHATLRRLYQQLFRLRREKPSLRTLDLASVETIVDEERRVLVVRRWSGSEQTLLAFNFSDREQSVDVRGAAAWKPLLETGAKLDGTRLTLPPAFALFTAPVDVR
jgi:maltooligosyltrehalose trehalohydrolase